MRTISGLWRWRRNPLCRPTDLAEARIALITLLLAVLLAPLTGLFVGDATRDDLRRTMREQHRNRQAVRAVVVRGLDRPLRDTDPETSTGGDTRSRVLARWTAPDGSRHRGTVLTNLSDPRPGVRFTLWTDRHGRTVARPLDSATATAHALLAGLCAALAAVALLESGRRLLLWHMVRRRHALWDQAWDRADPDWGRTGADN